VPHLGPTASGPDGRGRKTGGAREEIRPRRPAPAPASRTAWDHPARNPWLIPRLGGAFGPWPGSGNQARYQRRQGGQRKMRSFRQSRPGPRRGIPPRPALDWTAAFCVGRSNPAYFAPSCCPPRTRFHDTSKERGIGGTKVEQVANRGWRSSFIKAPRGAVAPGSQYPVLRPCKKMACSSSSVIHQGSSAFQHFLPA